MVFESHYLFEKIENENFALKSKEYIYILLSQESTGGRKMSLSFITKIKCVDENYVSN